MSRSLLKKTSHSSLFILREFLKYSQRQFSKRVNIAQGRICGIENGRERLSIENITTIKNYLKSIHKRQLFFDFMNNLANDLWRS